jgi:hypothetical protein
MQSLRQIKLIARFVLVWFALSVGVAIAAPLVNPKPMELICSGAGVMTLQVQTDDDAKSGLGHVLDCPLCATTLALPASFVRLTVGPIQPLAYVLQCIPSAILAAITAAPPPARGPPAFS